MWIFHMVAGHLPWERVLLITWPQIVLSISSYWSTKSRTPCNVQGVESHRLHLSVEPCHNTWSAVGRGCENGWSHLRMSPRQPWIPGPREIHLLVLLLLLLSRFSISSSRHYCRHRIFPMCTMMSTANSNSFVSLFLLCVCGRFCLFFLPCFTGQDFQYNVGWTWWWGTHHSPVPIQEGECAVSHHLCDYLIQDQPH